MNVSFKQGSTSRKLHTDVVEIISIDMIKAVLTTALNDKEGPGQLNHSCNITKLYISHIV
jgi:hypothetical protein